jgi:sec-independent protein translocase protein TatB
LDSFSFLGITLDWFKLLIILVVGLLLVGPEKLPSYARKAARIIRNIQKVIAAVTGDISKAINLDEEESGGARNFKKDLIDIKKSLEQDVVELKATLDGQAKAISETMESGTRDAVASLKDNAREISDTVSTQTGELKAALNAQAKVVSETVESGMKETAASLEQSAGEVSEAVEAPLQVDNSPPPGEKQAEALQPPSPLSPIGEAGPV